MCASVHTAVRMCVCITESECGDQRTSCWNQLPALTLWTQDWAQVVRLGRDCLYQQSHLGPAQPSPLQFLKTEEWLHLLLPLLSMSCFLISHHEGTILPKSGHMDYKEILCIKIRSMWWWLLRHTYHNRETANREGSLGAKCLRHSVLFQYVEKDILFHDSSE